MTQCSATAMKLIVAHETATGKFAEKDIRMTELMKRAEKHKESQAALIAYIAGLETNIGYLQLAVSASGNVEHVGKGEAKDFYSGGRGGVGGV